jgi:hypothetical protein
MGPCKRPGFTGEGTEPLAYRGAVPAIRAQAIARPTDTGVCRLRGIGCHSIDAVARPALTTVRFDDPHPPITQRKI